MNTSKAAAGSRARAWCAAPPGITPLSPGLLSNVAFHFQPQQAGNNDCHLLMRARMTGQAGSRFKRVSAQQQADIVRQQTARNAGQGVTRRRLRVNRDQGSVFCAVVSEFCIIISSVWPPLVRGIDSISGAIGTY